MQDIDLLHADKEDVVFLMEKIHDDPTHSQFSDSDLCLPDGHLILFDEQACMDFNSRMRQDSENIARRLAGRPPSLDDNSILVNYFEALVDSHNGVIPVPSRVLSIFDYFIKIELNMNSNRKRMQGIKRRKSQRK